MTRARPQRDNLAEIDALIASMRFGGAHIRQIEWRGQPAWLKLSVPQPPAWRYQLLAGLV